MTSGPTSKQKFSLGPKTEAYFQQNWKPFYGAYVKGHEMLSFMLSKDVSKRSKTENKGKKEKEMP